MSYTPIVEGSEATPGLWNSRFSDLWANVTSLNSSGVTASRTTTPFNGWNLESALTTPALYASLVSTTNLNINSSFSVAAAAALYMGSGAFFVNAISLGAQSNQYNWRVGFNGQSSANTNLQVGFQLGQWTSIFSGDGWLYTTPTAAGAVSKLVGPRQTGWTTVPTGTPIRTTFVTSTATLGDVAQRLAALIIDLTTHGLIGP